MKISQEKVKKFNQERNWIRIRDVKDILLNMNEEIGELWHIIKWVDVETQQKLISEHKKDVGNFMGDMAYLLLKLATICGVDTEEELNKVLEEFEGRFPKEEMVKVDHGNTLAGGIDHKLDK